MYGKSFVIFILYKKNMVDLSLRISYLYIYLSIPFEKFGLLNRYVCSSSSKNSTICNVLVVFLWCSGIGSTCSRFTFLNGSNAILFSAHSPRHGWQTVRDTLRQFLLCGGQTDHAQQGGLRIQWRILVPSCLTWVVHSTTASRCRHPATVTVTCLSWPRHTKSFAVGPCLLARVLQQDLSQWFSGAGKKKKKAND